MVTLLLATRNDGKVRELKELLSHLPVNVLCAKDINQYDDVEENGETFHENALIKARYGAKLTGFMTIADDSGLEVSALDGEPGVYSARFSGENASDEENNEKLLELLKDETQRNAKYKCAMALVTPKGEEITTLATCEGKILTKPEGNDGFGYDPLFFVEEYQCTFGELPLETKNKISHRAKATKRLIPMIEILVSEQS